MRPNNTMNIHDDDDDDDDDDDVDGEKTADYHGCS